MPAHPPIATYRLQLHADFPFERASAQVDYLAQLGISHVYSSPTLQAAPGSKHGYDVIDPTQVNQELGGEEAFRQFCDTLQQHELGCVIDIVPNHMSIASSKNAWWWDVQENGPFSRYAIYFDVDWEPHSSPIAQKVLLPILGEHYGQELTAGLFRLARRGGQFQLHYYDHVVPVALESLDEVLRKAAERCGNSELAFLADSLSRLPVAISTDRQSRIRRHRDKEVVRQWLARLCDEMPNVASAVDGVLQEWGSSPDILHELLERQHYRLAYWRTSQQELGYRRFFDINELIGLHIEDEQVFADVHGLALQWLEEGLIDGLRIDHIDGLSDPEEYLWRLRKACPSAWLVVEKVLEPAEQLPRSWPVAGTTGYDFLAVVGGLFVDPEHEAAFNTLYQGFTGESTDYETVLREKKLFILHEVLKGDVNRLTALLAEICERHRDYRDYSQDEMRQVIVETIASFPVYRAYLRPESRAAQTPDLRVIQQAIADAKEHRPELDPRLFDFLCELLLMHLEGELELDFALRFQQLTGPAMAKGAEDTAFYNYNRLVCLNDVGCSPGHFGHEPEAFHAFCKAQQKDWSTSMLATSTHDSKRSEDVRARISLLSEIPKRWEELVYRWSELTQAYRDPLVDRNTEYLFYQTLLGAWPWDEERAVAYFQKAIREAKAYTSWIEINPVYEEAIELFVRQCFHNTALLDEVRSFVESIATFGYINSLSQTLLKLTAPGIPDIYQGCELWDFSLVDPDNRRPVDYGLRRRCLSQLKELSVDETWQQREQGLPKLYLIRQALSLRHRMPEAFGPNSNYQPLAVQGAKARHVVAFTRRDSVVAVVPRLVLQLNHAWDNTTLLLPKGNWRNELTGELQEGKVALEQLLQRFPVALLSRQNHEAEAG